MREQFPRERVKRTSLKRHERLSDKYDVPVYWKDEREQPVRSYKNRGAYAKMLSLSDEERAKGIVCASAGNHAQGVADACNNFEVRGTIFMPRTTPLQKIEATDRHGNGFVTIELQGDTYDESSEAAHIFASEKDATYIHPFDDPDVIKGQATVALEIVNQMQETRDRLDKVVVPVGGGGLITGTILVMKELRPEVTVVGVEPREAAAMMESVDAGERVTLPKFDSFVDGAAVATVGKLPFEVVLREQKLGNLQLKSVSKGKLCSTMARLLQQEGEVIEPAGALSVVALDSVANDARGAIVCIISGNNLDMRRMPAILENAALYDRTKQYVEIQLPDRPGALLEMLLACRSEIERRLNINFMHFDEAENGNPPLQLGITSKTGSSIDIKEFLDHLASLQNEAGDRLYPFEEVNHKPSL